MENEDETIKVDEIVRRIAPNVAFVTKALYRIDYTIA